ncbi:hypothetical protein NDU88_004767 [Pleurodeles waltl]|uniref:Uncharacterized protein n=1 Tax=Pleurodeles waltl TaxID=8319 RepID=A0AAV7WWX0_PLEWA|nr:hypothetical protein NDU88_004767 [Pleurodeles waltl]
MSSDFEGARSHARAQFSAYLVLSPHFGPQLGLTFQGLLQSCIILFGSLFVPPSGAVSTLPGRHKTPVTIPSRRLHLRRMPLPSPISDFPAAGLCHPAPVRIPGQGDILLFLQSLLAAERCQ